METITNTPESAPVDPSAVMAELLKIAQSRRVFATREADQSIRIDFAEASVNVSLDSGNGMVHFDCTVANENPSTDNHSSAALSTFIPTVAASGETGPGNVYELAQTLALIVGFSTPPQ